MEHRSSPLDQCRWIGCRASRVDEIALCTDHYYEVGISFIEKRSIFGGKWREENEGRREAELRASLTQAQLREQSRREALAAQSVVYYVRIGDRVKIGYTVNLRQRLSALRADINAVLATEPGGRAEEAQRHSQFAAERFGRREDFNPSRRLLDHIARIRELHGAPVFTTYPKIS